MSTYALVYITAVDKDEAVKIANALTTEKKIACANIIDPIESIYRWQGAVENSQETLLLAKTTTAKLPELIQRVKELHSYENPAIVAIPILMGSDDYLDYVRAELAS